MWLQSLAESRIPVVVPRVLAAEVLDPCRQPALSLRVFLELECPCESVLYQVVLYLLDIYAKIDIVRRQVWLRRYLAPWYLLFSDPLGFDFSGHQRCV